MQPIINTLLEVFCCGLRTSCVVCALRAVTGVYSTCPFRYNLVSAARALVAAVCLSLHGRRGVLWRGAASASCARTSTCMGPVRCMCMQKTWGGWRRGALGRWCLCLRALGDYSVCLLRRRNTRYVTEMDRNVLKCAKCFWYGNVPKCFVSARFHRSSSIAPRSRCSRWP